MTCSTSPPECIEEKQFQKLYKDSMDESFSIDVEQLKKLNQSIPRYTSYPTAPEWGPLTPPSYENKLREFGRNSAPLSLYFHIPFCRSMCLYCGCAVILNRRPEKQDLYVEYLQKEIDLVTSYFDSPKTVRQLHFGGGTPTQLTTRQMGLLFEKIAHSFQLDTTGEIAIEIDPRSVSQGNGEKLRFLKSLGFNRVSFGIQDTNPVVQEAVRRRQSFELSQQTFHLAKEIGFTSVNLDLIYGLPHQTTETFFDTINNIIKLRPNRIALYSFAWMPWLKPHQKAIKEKDLPSTQDKFRIYIQARQQLLESGYVAIGMDHFVLRHDEMALAIVNKTLHRNFQGYTVKYAEDLMGFGITATGFVQKAYFQNSKTLSDYYSSLDSEQLPIFRGKILNEDDIIRQWVISSLMCHFELQKSAFSKRFNRDFDTYFSNCDQDIKRLINENFLISDKGCLKATLQGRFFIRNIACTFDAYLKDKNSQQRFSKAI